jgi:hypothetical protein
MSRLCKNNWVDTYVEYTYNQESPAAFHLWASICLLSAAIARNIWIPRIKYTIYPNIFVILVAGSAKCKKSTSIKISEKILRSIENHPLIFSQKITPEALIESLENAKVGGSSSGIIMADELSVFMGRSSNDSGIIPLLTTLYDSPEEWSYQTKSRGKEVLKNVTLTVLAGTTKVWLKSAIPSDSVAGGFASRIIFVYQEAPQRPILFYDETPHELELRRQLITDLATIRKEIKGPMEFSPDAKLVAQRWYEEEFYKTRDEKTDGYFSRKHDTMFKIASILSIAESSNRIISADNIKRALSMLAENEVHMENILSTVISSPTGDVTERILELVRRYDKIEHTEVLRKCWRYADAQQLTLYIRTLVDSGEIIEIVSADNRKRNYRIKGRA